MRNLTANAVKAVAGHADPVIEWRAWLDKGGPMLCITDNGSGIATEQIDLVTRTDVSIGIKSGLGLHLVLDLAKAIQATVAFASIPSGGATVTIRL